MESQESLLREKRTIEALRNDLMGPSGKLGTICRYLGNKIQYQSMASEDIINDPYEIQQDVFNNEALLDQTPVFDDDEYVYDVGWVFDGLSRGMHLEIKYVDHEKKLTVFYKGFQVYLEVAGELEAYAPFPEWEELIERLYTAAKDKKKKLRKEEKLDFEIIVQQKQSSFLQRMRMKWGI